MCGAAALQEETKKVEALQMREEKVEGDKTKVYVRQWLR